MDLQFTTDLDLTDTGDLELLDDQDSKKLQVLRAVSTPLGYISRLVEDNQGIYRINSEFGSRVYEFRAANIDTSLIRNITKEITEAIKQVDVTFIGVKSNLKADRTITLELQYSFDGVQHGVDLANIKPFTAKPENEQAVFLATADYWQVIAGFKLTIPIDLLRQNFEKDVQLLVTGVPDKIVYYLDKENYDNDIAFLTLEIPDNLSSRQIDIAVTSLGEDLKPTTIVLRIGISNSLFIFSSNTLNSTLKLKEF